MIQGECKPCIILEGHIFDMQGVRKRFDETYDIKQSYFKTILSLQKK